MKILETAYKNRLIPIRNEIPESSAEYSAAAVLILLVEINAHWNILFTRRTNEVSTHQGEVSFPGGAFEKGDISLLHTAIREAKEEIGVDIDCVQILGRLGIHQTISRFSVYPFVGILTCEPIFDLNKAEVERVFLIPVDWLKDEKNFYMLDHDVYGHIVKNVLHYYDYEGEHLWGLTARITQELLEIL